MPMCSETHYHSDRPQASRPSSLAALRTEVSRRCVVKLIIIRDDRRQAGGEPWSGKAFLLAAATHAALSGVRCLTRCLPHGRPTSCQDHLGFRCVAAVTSELLTRMLRCRKMLLYSGASTAHHSEHAAAALLAPFPLPLCPMSSSTLLPQSSPSPNNKGAIASDRAVCIDPPSQPLPQ